MKVIGLIAYNSLKFFACNWEQTSAQKSFFKLIIKWFFSKNLGGFLKSIKFSIVAKVLGVDYDLFGFIQQQFTG